VAWLKPLTNPNLKHNRPPKLSVDFVEMIRALFVLYTPNNAKSAIDSFLTATSDMQTIEVLDFIKSDDMWKNQNFLDAVEGVLTRHVNYIVQLEVRFSYTLYSAFAWGDKTTNNSSKPELRILNNAFGALLRLYKEKLIPFNPFVDYWLTKSPPTDHSKLIDDSANENEDNRKVFRYLLGASCYYGHVA
jgi:hypothetical protein